MWHKYSGCGLLPHTEAGTLVAICPYSKQFKQLYIRPIMPVGMLNSFLNIRSSFPTIRILFEVRKWPQHPGDDAQRPLSLLHHLITQQVVHARARPRGSLQRESAHLPTTTDASSKRPTTDSKDHDRRLTIISRYAGYFEVAPGHEAPRWVGWTGLDGCKAVTGLPTFSTRIVIYLILSLIHI